MLSKWPNRQMDINFEKTVMIYHKDREVRFKCNIFWPKAQNEDMYFKCKKHDSTFEF